MHRRETVVPHVVADVTQTSENVADLCFECQNIAASDSELKRLLILVKKSLLQFLNSEADGFDGDAAYTVGTKAPA